MLAKAFLIRQVTVPEVANGLHRSHASPTLPDLPIIGLEALLSLAEWIEERRIKSQQGGSSCDDHPANASPPRRNESRARPPLSRLWLALTDDQRKRTLRALSRVVVHQLAGRPGGRGVAHDEP